MIKMKMMIKMMMKIKMTMDMKRKVKMYMKMKMNAGSIEKDSRLARRANRSCQRQARLHTVGLWCPRAGGPTASLRAEFGQRPAYSVVRDNVNSRISSCAR